MITNLRQFPAERFTPNVRRILDTATRHAWDRGRHRVGVVDLERALDIYVEQEIVGISETEAARIAESRQDSILYLNFANAASSNTSA